MSDKKLAILGLIAVIMAGAAVLQSRISNRVKTAEFSTSPLIEGLDVDLVSVIRITSENGTQTVTLKQQDGSFVVADKDDYPADVSRINSLINNCLDIRTVEKITSNPSNHADLKVTDETAQYVVDFQAEGDKSIVKLLVSETNTENNTAYARLSSSDDVYSIQNPPFINTEPMNFINATLVEVQNDKVQQVAVTTPDGAYVLTSPTDSDDINLEAMPEGKQYKGTEYKTVFNALSSVRFDDVSAIQNAPADLSFEYAYTANLYDLTVYKFELAKKDDKVYAKVTADYLDKTPVEKTVGEVESDEELKKKEAKLLATDNVKAFNAKHANWVYQIPSYKADVLTKSLSDILEDVKVEDESMDTASADAAMTPTEE